MKPTRLANDSVIVNFSMELYQIIEVVGKQKSLLVWLLVSILHCIISERTTTICPHKCMDSRGASIFYFLSNHIVLLFLQRWRDELLYWDPGEFEDINEIMLPHDTIWLPVSPLIDPYTHPFQITLLYRSLHL